MPAYLRLHREGTVVSLYIQPRSSRNQVVGLQDASLKIKLTSPPVDGAANKCCCAYLAKLFHMPKSNVELISGARSRHKKILLRGQDLQFVATIFQGEISTS